MDNKIFREQIKEDIDLLKLNLQWDPYIEKDEYTFNYWILSNIYSLDEEESNYLKNTLMLSKKNIVWNIIKWLNKKLTLS